MSLFEPDAYTAPGRTPRRPRRPTQTPPDPPPATVEIHVTDLWRYAHRTTPGVVHCTSSTDKRCRTRSGALVTFCGLVGIPLTYTIGETVHGCAVCIQKGAPT